MSSIKSHGKKMKLVKATRQNRRIPAFVIGRTKGAVSYNRKNRNWRYDKLGISE
ncbi:50S ribosomal protein L39e [Candidatus Micrarchaeota archaeon]|nr:50S ribosomal protein L39e [Candidatus Micrarchaeota archaeon]